MEVKLPDLLENYGRPSDRPTNQLIDQHGQTEPTKGSCTSNKSFVISHRVFDTLKKSPFSNIKYKSRVFKCVSDFFFSPGNKINFPFYN